jgi:hypothetical protein
MSLESLNRRLKQMQANRTNLDIVEVQYRDLDDNREPGVYYLPNGDTEIITAFGRKSN